MTKNLKYLLLFCIVALALGCKNQKSDANVLAEYKGVFLLKNDIPEDILTKFTKGDTNSLLSAYIDKWLENQVLLNAAEELLSPEEKDKEKLVNDYRNSLLIFEYQQKLITESLDTSVSDAEIEKFYLENEANFVLKKNIVKIRYIKIEKRNADINIIKKLIQSPSPSNDAILTAYSQEKAINFYLDSNWLYLDDITKEIPLNENYNQQRFLTSNKYIQLEENNMLYILYIIDFRIKDNSSPIEFEKEKIKEIILYQRKMNFLKETQQNLYNKAIEKSEIKYHLK